MKIIVSWIFMIALLAAGTSALGQEEYSELDIKTLQRLMQQGDLSSAKLTAYHLQRIEAIGWPQQQVLWPWQGIAHPRMHLSLSSLELQTR